MFLDLDKKDKSAVAAIDDTRECITYGGLCAFAAEWSRLVPSRTLIFILAQNSLGALAGYVASLSTGVVPLMLNSRTDRELLDALIARYTPRYLWLPASLCEEFSYRPVYSRWGYSLLDTDLASPSLYNDLSLLLPTSGSTGSSKLVRHSYRNIEANARNVSRLFALTSSERALAILPMYYTMGLSVVASHLYSGATLLLTSKSLTDKGFWSLLKEERATSFTGVPYSFEVLEKLRFFRMELPDLKIITQGGGKLSESLFLTCARYAADTGKQFIATYGQTEGTARMAYLPPEWALQKICSIGHAIPGGALSLIDEEGREIEEPEATGEMVYRGENVTLGYAYTPLDLMKGDENGGLLHTGDLARRDKDGCYYILGRKGRFLKLYGLRVGLDECEHILKDAFGIECACVGNDSRMSIYITNPAYEERAKMLLVEKIHLIASAFRVVCIHEIPKNEAGKTLFSQLEV